MKIKVQPEDFIVEEEAAIRPFKSGPFLLFRLQKQGWNTVDLLSRLSREFCVPYKDFSYGGKKDRHALTRQYVTIRCDRVKGRMPDIAEAAYSLSFLGYMDRPMGPDLIEANRFRITVRDLSGPEVRQAVEAIDEVRETGYPNYFDDQRFGSFDPAQGFMGEKVLFEHYNGALRIYLTRISSEDRKEEKGRKRFFSDHWGDWSACLERAKSPFERNAFQALQKDTRGFLPVLRMIPREELSLYFSAYQAFLWNELLRRVVRLRAQDSLRVHAGATGDYLFYTSPERDPLQYLQGLSIPTPASNAAMPDELTAMLYIEILKERGLRPSQFNMRKIRQAFFKASPRPAIVVPGGLSSVAGADEIYKYRQKLTLEFRLRRGSYGTMLIKRLFSSTISPEGIL